MLRNEVVLCVSCIHIACLHFRHVIVDRCFVAFVVKLYCVSYVYLIESLHVRHDVIAAWCLVAFRDCIIGSLPVFFISVGGKPCLIESCVCQLILNCCVSNRLIVA